MRASGRSGSRLVSWTPVALVFALITVLLGGPQPGAAYYFYSAGKVDWNAAPTAQDAMRWKRAVWEPGGTLTWHVVEDPDWRPVFANASEALPYVKEALDEWSAIPTADLRMQLAGVVQGDGGRRDGRNTIFAEGDASRAISWEEYDQRRDRWEIVECDVVIAGFAVAEIPDPDHPGDGGLRHELGHCLGLYHSEGSPGVHWWQRQNDVWTRDPIMSKKVGAPAALTADETVGVSLLRPAPGWLGTTGSLGGKVTVDGRPAVLASAHLLHRENARLRSKSIHVFTNGKGEGVHEEDGVFLAEGLAPGDYLLWIRPEFKRRDRSSEIKGREGVEASLNDLTVLRLFRVESGRTTWAGEFELRRGRTPE